MVTLFFKVSFEPGEVDLNKSFIGKIDYKIQSKIISAKMLSERLQSEKYKILDKNIEINDLCMLPNNEILIASCNKRQLTLYNKKFEIIKNINKINDELFSPLSLATDNINRIYICDSFNQQILMTDLDFNLIGKFNGRYGNTVDKLRYPQSIFYYENNLYISDRANNRIIKLTKYLKYQTSFTVDFQPSTIKISNDIACIKSANTNSIHFYDLTYPPYFNFKCQFDEHFGTISVINSLFFMNSTIKIEKFIVLIRVAQ
jgi:hypothetical protein